MSERPRTVRELLAEAEHFLPENMSCPEAKEFAEAVAKQLRAEYAPKVATGVEWYIYRKEEPFAMGYVGYADGVLVGSVLSAIAGLLVLHLALPKQKK